MVKNKAQYHAKHYERIRQLKALARKAKGYNKYNIYKNIFDLYAHYQTDSAQVYIDAMTRLPEYKSDVVMQATLHIAQAEIYAVSALYTEAISELERCHTPSSTMSMPTCNFTTFAPNVRSMGG